MERIIEPELLDELEPADPRAIHSRRDLRRINYWMGNQGHIHKQLLRIDQPRRILEIGAGDGTVMARVAKKFGKKWKNVEVGFLDLHPVISEEARSEIESNGWKIKVYAQDVREWVQKRDEKHDLVLANLFLHHFSFEELGVFFKHFSQSSGAFLACDPRRWKPALLAVKFLWLIRCNSVTRHDAHVSVRAGFREQELTRTWPQNTDFELDESDPGYASHLFFARKK